MHPSCSAATKTHAIKTKRLNLRNFRELARVASRVESYKRFLREIGLHLPRSFPFSVSISPLIKQEHRRVLLIVNIPARPFYVRHNIACIKLIVRMCELMWCMHRQKTLVRRESIREENAQLFDRLEATNGRELENLPHRKGRKWRAIPLANGGQDDIIYIYIYIQQ